MENELPVAELLLQIPKGRHTQAYAELIRYSMTVT